MHRSSVRPNEYTFVSTLHACSFAESVDLICAFQVYALVIRLGFGSNMYLVNAFLTALIRHGMLGEAIQAFEGCLNKDIVSWNAMFDGFLKYSCDDIPGFWQRMSSEGIKPDEFTFATVLTGLAELSNLEIGLQAHALLVKSGHDHYVCMVNLLGRAGRIKEAEELILGMPFKPSVLIWQTLLGASRLHGDVETAKRAAGHAFAIDENDPSTYVLLSNTFAEFENWSSAGTLRKWIENRDIKKMPGSSWLEVNQDHSFKRMG
ncbi:Pentatricopeptide repeat-containing protein [Sesamum alatum]|uniref:Pentatricopeptide repeat-containing protein n=1 Tax=Sesamum alatum TaxID=300844 RepID=A0AAE1YDD6_9LAMI|nr:Pentatricopeptide repeat-containing protein [Sesamum alatum]